MSDIDLMALAAAIAGGGIEVVEADHRLGRELVQHPPQVAQVSG